MKKSNKKRIIANFGYAVIPIVLMQVVKWFICVHGGDLTMDLYVIYRFVEISHYVASFLPLTISLYLCLIKDRGVISQRTAVTLAQKLGVL